MVQECRESLKDATKKAISKDNHKLDRLSLEKLLVSIRPVLNQREWRGILKHVCLGSSPQSSASSGTYQSPQGWVPAWRAVPEWPLGAAGHGGESKGSPRQSHSRQAVGDSCSEPCPAAFCQPARSGYASIGSEPHKPKRHSAQRGRRD